MIRKIALTLIIGLLMFSSSSWAQRGRPASHRPTQPALEHSFEIIPMGGYTWTLSRSMWYNSRNGDIDLKSSSFWGIAVDINAIPGVQARLLYRRQDTDVTFRPFTGGVKETLGKVGVEYWHAGVVKSIKMQGNVMPFSSFTLGATRYDLSKSDEWKFSIILGLGAKIYLNDRIGLMLTGQMPYSFTDAYIGVGTGGASVGGYGIAQFDVAGGLIITL